MNTLRGAAGTIQNIFGWENIPDFQKAEPGF
jgi:hypothetical protein